MNFRTLRYTSIYFGNVHIESATYYCLGKQFQVEELLQERA